MYILTDQNDRTLYIGVTGDLPRRLREHRNGEIAGFSKTYHLHKLIYYEDYADVTVAIAREKQLKGWTRRKKDLLIKQKNPDLDDWAEGVLYGTWGG